MSRSTLETQVLELLGYVRGFFEANQEVPIADPNAVANVILEGAIEQAVQELRGREKLDLATELLGKSHGAELVKPRDFSFLGMASALENAAGIARMAQALHDRIVTTQPVAAGSESEAAE